MNRRLELLLVTILLLMAAVLRTWDLTSLPPGFSNDELAYIRITETVRDGDIKVYYHVGDGQGRAVTYALGNATARSLVGDGLLGYRVASVWVGLLTLAALYALARRLFGSQVALIALGVMSVNLRAILLARTAAAETFVPFYTLLVLYGLAEAFNLRREVRFRAVLTLPFALLAVLLGASGYLHYSTLVLGPLAALFFIHLLITHQPLSRRVWSAAFFVIALATVVAVPFFISTLREPDASEASTLWDQRPSGVGDAIDSALQAVGGVIWKGDALATHNLPDAPLIGPVMSLLLIIGLIEAIRCWRQPGYTLILLALAAGLATDAWVGTGPNFDANLVALPAVMILPGIGLMALWDRLRVQRGMQRAWHTIAVILVLLLAANLVAVRVRLFDSWREDEAVADLYHANLGNLAAYLDRTPDGLPVSMCVARLRAPGDVGLSSPQILSAMMHREDMSIRHSDCRSGLVFINAGAPMRFIFANPDDRASMPPELADWLADAEPIQVDRLPDGTVLRLDVEQRIRDAGGTWKELSQTFFAPDQDDPGGPADLPVALEQNLTFAGYDPAALQDEREAGGDPIVLVTYWRVDGQLPPRLGIFTHVLAFWENPETGAHVPNPEPWAEANTIDVIPAELEPRDLFAQVSYIWLGETLKPGEYALMVGAYADGVYNHLGVLDRETGDYRGDRLLLGTIQVTAPSEDLDGGAAGEEP
ncbi:MAG: glycosyltransferase family 39 protein [Anaerolineae bacterium]|nr:glycosyltransferase family 39 protein [Anaerolineae bacterium]